MRFKKIILGIALSLSVVNMANAKCDEQKALALNIYHEARGEPLKGKLMVAEVVINRVESKRFPKSICGVIYDENQFEWVDTNPPVKDKKEFDKIYNLSGQIIDGEVDLPGSDALFFKSSGVKSTFHAKRIFVGKVGNHEFYK